MAIKSEFGIIFYDYFLNQSEFINIFKEYYRENNAIINDTVNKLKGLLASFADNIVTENNYKAFQSAWDEFEKHVLGNMNPLQLLVVYRGTRTKEAKISQIIDQRQVEEAVNGHYGINTAGQAIKDSIETVAKSQELEEALQRHSWGLIQQLENPINRDQAHALHYYHNDLLKPEYKTIDMSQRKHITGMKWHRFVYGNMWVSRWRGEAYEAFFNHLADCEPNIFHQLSQHSVRNASQMAINNLKNGRSVFQEEGGEREDLGNFPRLMLGQINSIPWFAGGDIVIVNKNKEVVYNIQLKTTNFNNPTVFQERVGQLRQFLIAFTSEQNVEKKASLLFQNFKNTVAGTLSDELGKVSEKDITDMIREKIKTKYTIT